MQLLFTMDQDDYFVGLPCLKRCAVRALIEQEGKVLLMRSRDGMYKLPGGGIEQGEDHACALARELLEETGLLLDEASLAPLGMVDERRRDYHDPRQNFVQRSFYYACATHEAGLSPTLTQNEQRLGLHAVWLPLAQAIDENRRIAGGVHWMLRDTRFLETIRDIRQKKEDITP